MKIKVVKDGTGKGGWNAFDEDNVSGDVTYSDGIAHYISTTLIGHGASEIDAIRNWIDAYEEQQELEGRFCPGAD